MFNTSSEKYSRATLLYLWHVSGRGVGKYALAGYPYLRELVGKEYEVGRDYPGVRVYIRRD